MCQYDIFFGFGFVSLRVNNITHVWSYFLLEVWVEDVFHHFKQFRFFRHVSFFLPGPGVPLLRAVCVGTALLSEAILGTRGVRIFVSLVRDAARRTEHSQVCSLFFCRNS